MSFMNKKFLLFITLILTINWSFGQISEGGKPKSFELKYVTRSFEEVSVNSLDQSRIDELVSDNEKNGGYYKIGKSIPVDISLSKNGTWTDIGDGAKIWRLKITSQGAKALVLYYNNFYIPKGGKLFVYNNNKTQVIGAYTQSNNSEYGTFATEMIQGESAILEYFQPAGLTNNPIIDINQVGYIFRAAYFPNLPQTRDFGTAATCHPNVNCSEGDNWQDQKKGVVRILLTAGGSQGWCSGSVINTVKQEYIPYILTADHCGAGATTPELTQWIFYFNYEAPSCSNPTSEGTLATQTMTGCTKIANGGNSGDAGSDFYLVRLSNDIPENYTPYFNGWDSRDVAPTSGVGIHHPTGDIKKISTYNSTLTTSGWNGSGYNSHWEVPWVATTNGYGVTEGGSSGSPLFDQNKRIIGDLTGGGSYCTATSEHDFYGKFSYSWLSNGTTSDTQLKPWLDPDNTGTQFVNGSYYVSANFTEDVTNVVVTGKVTFTNTSTGNPTSWKWVFEGGTPASSSLQTPPQIQYNTVGIYDVTLIVTKGTLKDTLVMTDLIHVLAPYADFTENQTNILVSRYVTFKDTSFGNPTTWKWTFEGGTPASSSLQNPPPIQYNTVGLFDVTLMITKGTYKDTLVKADHINVYPPEIHAYFDVDRDTLAQFQGATFTDTSFCDTTITSWFWVFEGATPDTVTVENPANIKYDSLGIFDVYLKVCNDWGCDSILKQNYIYVIDTGGHPPIANLWANKTLVNLSVDSLVNFTDLSYYNPTDWQWTFTGAIPSSSSLQSPQGVKYTTPGVYPVKLVALNAYGTDTLVKTAYITVTSGVTTSPPVAKFTVTRHLIQVGENVNYTDLSTGGPVQTWNWTFEGATPASSTEQHPLQVLYSTSGVYKVALTVTNMAGTSTKSIDQYIFVSSSPVSNYCDSSIANYNSIEATNLVTPTVPGSTGYMSGHNGKNVTEFADYFDYYIYTQVKGLLVSVSKAVAGNVNSKVVFKVWSVGSNGLPGNVLGSKEIKLNTLHPTYVHSIMFDEPVDIFGSFFAGYEISYQYPDEFATYIVSNRSQANDLGILNSFYLKQNNAWVSSTSLYSYKTSSTISPISCIVGTDELSKIETELLIFPNPSSSVFNLYCNSSDFEKSEISVYNIYGKKVNVVRQQIDNSNAYIDLTGNASGIYFVNIMTNNSLITRKISFIK